MNAYERQLLRTAELAMANSPNLANTQKAIIEKLFEQIYDVIDKQTMEREE